MELVGATGDVQDLAEALKANESRRQQLGVSLARLQTERPWWMPESCGHTPRPPPRQILRKLPDGPVRVEMMPNAEGIRLRSRNNLGALCPSVLASLTGLSWNQLEGWLRAVDGLRLAA